MAHLTDAAETIVSELVANAVNASSDGRGQPAYRNGRILLLCVRLHADETTLRAEVWDQAPGVPVRKNVGADAESGRGLALVDDLSGAWGWYPIHRQPGKCVWAEIPIASDQHALSLGR
jgi:anti-sigma regulatory factor (Ser/Thr protein kinase)